MLYDILSVHVVTLATSQSLCPSPISDAGTLAGFCASRWATLLDDPRGITFSPVNGDLLVVERGQNRITGAVGRSRAPSVTIKSSSLTTDVAFFDANGDGESASPEERVVLAKAPGINHGIAINGRYLYASSATTLYRC